MDGCKDGRAAPGESTWQIEDGNESDAAEQTASPETAACLECSPPCPLAREDVRSLTPAEVLLVLGKGPCTDNAAGETNPWEAMPDGNPASGSALPQTGADPTAAHQEPHPLGAASPAPRGGAAGSGNTAAEDSIILQSYFSEFQKLLPHSLTGLTHKRPGEPPLPADFRLQLQLLESSLQQRKLMQRLTYQQQCARAQLDTVCTQGLRHHGLVEERLTALQQHLDRLTAQVEFKFPVDQTKAAAPVEDVAAVTKVRAKEVIAKRDAEAAIQSLAAEMITSSVDRVKVSAEPDPEDNYLECTSTPVEGKEEDWDSSSSPTQAQAVHRHFKLAGAPPASRKKKRPKKKYNPALEWLRRMISSVYFDALCGIVIVGNALTIGMHTQDSMDYAISHLGEPEKAPPDFVRKAGYFFCAFYTVEILLKLVVFRCGFFQGDLWKWNVFDFLLVVLGLYDLIMEELVSEDQGGGMDVMWVRLLRLLKMLKMLRVVRVMRFFRVLRMMVSSIAGSMMTLVWSILMLSLMMYIFSICFLQSIIGYLCETSKQNMAPDVMEAIVAYWSSVYQSMITLYIAVTGGSDWEPLAKPLLEAGPIGYGLFLFYIAFTAFAVLNVMTGLYCDTASKISEMDDENVKVEEVENFREYFLHHSHRGSVQHQSDTSDGERGDVTRLTRDTFESNLASKIVQTFFSAVEIKEEDAKRIFTILDTLGEGVVELEDFVSACVCYNRGPTSFDMVSLNAENKGYMESVQKNIGEMQSVIEKALPSCKADTRALDSPRRSSV